MSKKINIRGFTDNNNDVFYRYKMEKLICSEQKGKTIINNIEHIAKALNRPPDMIKDYYKKRIGGNIIYKDNKMVLPKKMLPDELENILFEYIEYNVLCPNCKLPETKLLNKQLICSACSYTS